MHHPQVTISDRAAYGLTFSTRTQRGVRRVGHNGAITNFGAVLDMAPDNQVAVIALYNRLPREFALPRIINRLIDRLLELPDEAPEGI